MRRREGTQASLLNLDHKVTKTLLLSPQGIKNTESEEGEEFHINQARTENALFATGDRVSP